MKCNNVSGAGATWRDNPFKGMSRKTGGGLRFKVVFDGPAWVYEKMSGFRSVHSREEYKKVKTDCPYREIHGYLARVQVRVFETKPPTKKKPTNKGGGRK